MAKYSVLILITAVTYTGCISMDHIKGFYCQDPDTGNLYPLNATWRSVSFCGNYTCKLRKVNITETQYKPLVINITKPNITIPSSQQDIEENIEKVEKLGATTIQSITDQSNYASNIVTVESMAPPSVKPVMEHSIDKYNNTSVKNHKDRYLTDAEIESLAHMLRTVKKSDLDALVEIYHAAQDIFSDIDVKSKEVSTNIIDNTVQETKHKPNTVSYFYRPLHKTPNINDASLNGYPFIQGKPSYPTNRPAIPSELKQAPYYYHPLNNYQRPVSYVQFQPTPIFNNYQQMIQPIVPSYRKDNQENVFNWYNAQLPKYRPTEAADPVSIGQGPALLPYPYTTISKTDPNFASFYQLGGPCLDKKHHQMVSSDDEKVNSKETSDKIPIEANDKDKAAINEIKPNAQLPEWKTDPLTGSILNDIRAKILDKSLLQPIPLRKKIKLERVGNVFKVNEEKRTKREIGEDYETFIDKTTCEPTHETEPGYFKMGSADQPYPECCPKRIAVNPEQVVLARESEDPQTMEPNVEATTSNESFSF